VLGFFKTHLIKSPHVTLGNGVTEGKEVWGMGSIVDTASFLRTVDIISLV